MTIANPAIPNSLTKPKYGDVNSFLNVLRDVGQVLSTVSETTSVNVQQSESDAKLVGFSLEMLPTLVPEWIRMSQLPKSFLDIYKIYYNNKGKVHSYIQENVTNWLQQALVAGALSVDDLVHLFENRAFENLDLQTFVTLWPTLLQFVGLNPKNKKHASLLSPAKVVGAYTMYLALEHGLDMQQVLKQMHLGAKMQHVYDALVQYFLGDVESPNSTLGSRDSGTRFNGRFPFSPNVGKVVMAIFGIMFVFAPVLAGCEVQGNNNQAGEAQMTDLVNRDPGGVGLLSDAGKWPISVDEINKRVEQNPLNFLENIQNAFASVPVVVEADTHYPSYVFVTDIEQFVKEVQDRNPGIHIDQQYFEDWYENVQELGQYTEFQFAVESASNLFTEYPFTSSASIIVPISKVDDDNALNAFAAFSVTKTGEFNTNNGSFVVIERLKDDRWVLGIPDPGDEKLNYKVLVDPNSETGKLLASLPDTINFVTLGYYLTPLEVQPEEPQIFAEAEAANLATYMKYPIQITADNFAKIQEVDELTTGDLIKYHDGENFIPLEFKLVKIDDFSTETTSASSNKIVVFKVQAPLQKLKDGEGLDAYLSALKDLSIKLFAIDSKDDSYVQDRANGILEVVKIVFELFNQGEAIGNTFPFLPTDPNSRVNQLDDAMEFTRTFTQPGEDGELIQPFVLLELLNGGHELSYMGPIDNLETAIQNIVEENFDSDHVKYLLTKRYNRASKMFEYSIYVPVQNEENGNLVFIEVPFANEFANPDSNPAEQEGIWVLRPQLQAVDPNQNEGSPWEQNVRTLPKGNKAGLLNGKQLKSLLDGRAFIPITDALKLRKGGKIASWNSAVQKKVKNRLQQVVNMWRGFRGNNSNGPNSTVA